MPYLLLSKVFPQNVGIGTTAPAFKLDVKNGSINTDSVYRINTFQVLSINGNGNFFAGKDAGISNTGNGNTGAGSLALFQNTSGSYNTAIGYSSLTKNITGSNNTATGFASLPSNTTGHNNTSNGSNSLYFTNTGTDNASFGAFSMFLNTVGSFNVAVGSASLNNNATGKFNSANGYQALYANSTGDYNVATGYQALQLNNGSANVAVGSQVLFSNTTGSSNTALGQIALSGNTTGSFNTVIGAYADVSKNNLTDATAIGSASQVGCSNCLVLGGTQINHTYVGINNAMPLTDLHIIQYTDNGADKVRGIRLQRSVNTNHWRTLIDPSNNYVFEYNNALYTYINPTTGAYINPSDARLKKDITPLGNMLDKVMALTPKKFHYKTNKGGDPLSWGFIAQDVQKIFPEFIDVKDDGYLGIAYSNFSIVAIKAIQEQQTEIEELKKENQKLKEENEELKNQHDRMDERLTKIESELFNKKYSQ